MLVVRFLTQLVWIKWVSKIPVSVVEHCFRPPSWHKWMKLLEIVWNYNLLLMIFLISLLILLSKMMDWKVLEELYNSLLGLGIIMDVETLKCNGQWPNSMYVLVILINFLRHVAFLIILLKCLYDNLSGPGVNELLHYVIVFMNSSSENGLHFVTSLLGISSSKSEFI